MTGIIQGLLSSIGGKSLPQIGAAYEGGYFAGQISTAGNGVADYNLVIAPRSSGGNFSLAWQDSFTFTPGTSSDVDGATNTANMDDAAHPAAQFCAALSIGGFSDWYMPARNELEILVYYFKPSSADNNTTTSGQNTNAVPSRAGTYPTSFAPSETTATDFLSYNSEALTGLSNNITNIFSSTQVDATFAKIVRVASGGGVGYGWWFNTGKVNASGVRAIRKVAV